MGKQAGKEKRTALGVGDALRRGWRESAVRAAMREATGLDDAGIERAVAQEQTEQELAEFAQGMVREALVPVLEGVIARAQKENTAARLLLELAEAGRLVGLKKPEEPTPEEEATAFERAILGNLRELLRNEPKESLTAETQRTQRGAGEE